MDLILTVDVEDWYQTNGYNFPPETWEHYEDRVVMNTTKLLDLLEVSGIRGTFFVLGYVAEKHPELVREIFDRGHEIGCHGYFHQLIDRGEKAAVIGDIARAKMAIEAIIGEKVKGFRAPSWSLGVNEIWLYRELIELGFEWDSSLQPFKTPLSGFHQGPTEPFRPTVDGKTLDIVEFPVSVCVFGPFKIPYSGGFYLRLMPYWIAKSILKWKKDKALTMIYIHPWELDGNRPKIKTTLLSHMIHGYHTQSHLAKLTRLTQDFKMGPMGDAIRGGNFKALKLQD